MQFGGLCFQPVAQRLDLVADPLRSQIQSLGLQAIQVCEIDETLADTAAFCERYDIGLEVSANCVIIEAKRADKLWHVACVILATTKVDVNGIVRRHVAARKTSFAPMDSATLLTGMQYGGISPIGLPADWPILIDTQVANTEKVIIGSGFRKSKVLAPSSVLAALPTATVLSIAKEA